VPPSLTDAHPRGAPAGWPGTPEHAPRLIAAAAGGYTLLVGAITLLGYLLDVRRLADWINQGIAMFPNAALCSALSGVALLVLTSGGQRPSGRVAIVLRVLAGITGLLGGLTLLQHLTGANLGIDLLLSDRTFGQRAAVAPNRMGPPASSSFLLAGATFLLATYGQAARRLASALAIVIVAIASLSLVGYWFGADHLFGAARYTGIAFQTSTALAAIGIGLIASVPEHGLAAMLRRDDPGGVIIRRLLLPIIAIPLVVGWFRVWGQITGYFDTAFGSALAGLIMIFVLVSLLWWTAMGISRQAQLARGADAARRDSEARYRALIESSVYGVITIDQAGIIQSANPAAERLFGYSSSEMIGRNVSMLMPEPYKREHDTYLHNYLATGVRKIIGIGREVAGRRKDGSTFPMDLAVAEFQHGGKRHFTGTVHDISVRKGAEQALKDADRNKNEFLATLGHELRNPLNAIGVALALLEADRDSPAGDEARAVIGRQYADMVRLVDDLLDLSRISRGAIHLKLEPVELAPLLNDVARDNQRLCESLGHQLAVELPAQPITLHADPTRLRQMVGNLLTNAFRYTPRGGKILLEASRHDKHAVIRVVDSGVGLSAQDLGRVFDMFVQIRDDQRTAPRGLGIGLSLVRNLAQLHGGSVVAASAGAGQGCTFTLRLPLEPPPQAPQVPPGKAASSAAGRST
jgi:PAS domain S-box-containing protein